MTKYFLGLLIVVLPYLSSTGIVLAKDSKQGLTQIVTSPNDERLYQPITLDNGIDIILVSDPSVDKSAAALSVGVGLLNDPMSQQGMAHYLEHMLFLGTKRFPETNGYNEFMSTNGGTSNAYTWLDITNYMFEINNDAFGEALDRFSDFFKSPKLYKEYSKKEREAVNAEWSMRKEMDYFGQYKLDRLMMGSHPANRFLIGNLETLSDKERSKLHPELVAFYDKYYSANIMKGALISNLPLKEMENLARRYFSEIKNKQIKKPTITEKLDFSKIGKKRIHYVPNEDVKKLIIDFTIENNIQEYAVKPNTFVTYLIGSEMPGSAASELKKMGLIASLNASEQTDQYGNYGSLSIEVELTDLGMEFREKISAVIMQYIEKIKRQGVDSKYFKEIKISLENSFKFLEKTNDFSYVSDLTDNMQKYPVEHVIKAPYLYEKFDADAINRVLNQLTADRLRIWYISKNEPHDKSLKFYDGKYKIVDISSGEIKQWQEEGEVKLSLPQVNNLMPENFKLKNHKSKEYKTPELVIDEKDIKAWLMHSQYFPSQPKGVLRVYLNSPQKQEAVKGQILLALWRELFEQQHSSLLTEASIAGMNVTLEDLHGLQLTIGGFTDKQNDLLKETIKGLMINFSNDEFEQAVDRYIRELNNDNKQFPIYQLFSRMRNITTQSGYDNRTLINTAISLKPKDLSVFIENVLSNNQVRILGFGNYNQKDMLSFVSLLKSNLPKERKITNYVTTNHWKPKEGDTYSYKEDLEVSDVAVYDLYIHPEASLTQEARAKVLAEDLSTQIFDVLRTEEQLAYAVTAVAASLHDYTGIAFAIQTPVKNAKDMQLRFQDFKISYAKRLDELSEDTFAKLKNSVLVGLKEKPKNLNEEQLPYLKDWYQEKWTFDTQQKLISEVEKLTLKDIKAFYQEATNNPKAARLLIQLRGSKFKDKPFATLKDEVLIQDLQEFHQKIDYQ